MPLQETGVFTESVMQVAHSKKDLPSSEVVYPDKPFHHEGRFNWVGAILLLIISVLGACMQTDILKH